jgi:hypothetical protein
MKEPRKSDAPQLRDEYRTYKILVGCGMAFIDEVNSSWNSKRVLFWTGRVA